MYGLLDNTVSFIPFATHITLTTRRLRPQNYIVSLLRTLQLARAGRGGLG